MSVLSNIVGVISVLGYFINTVFWCCPIFALSVLKLLPFSFTRRWLSYILDWCATCWISINNLNQKLTSRTDWQVSGLETLTPKDWYLVISNHQTWVDILVLQRVFNRKIPFLKFFLKQELIWVPFLGLAWWALDFPFMQRYSKQFLQDNPHLKGKDMDTTRKACQKFRNKPVSIMNFLEGTRYTPAKHRKQQSPYDQLLRPRAGGVGFVISAMGQQLHKLVNVTIAYPEGIPTFWDFVCGRVNTIRVEIEVTPIQTLFDSGVFDLDMLDDTDKRSRFHEWLNALWQQKDLTLAKLLDENKQ